MRDLGKNKEWHKEYREKKKEELKAKRKIWREKNKDKLRIQHTEAMRKYRAQKPQKSRDANMKRRNKLKQMAYDRYGGAICACCGEIEPAFLSIDHINNDGYTHRQNGLGGFSIYDWLKKHNFPDGFQILCMNCNMGKARNNGVCPHKTSAGPTTISKESTAKRPEARSTEKR